MKRFTKTVQATLLICLLAFMGITNLNAQTLFRGYASNSTFFIDNGEFYYWGDNNLGQLGNNSTTDKLTPTKLGTVTTWNNVSTGNSYTVAIRNNGTLWAWGDNAAGQLGDGSNTQRLTPVQVGTNTTWASVACGYVFTVAIRSNGSLWTWGNNQVGQLGKGNAGNGTHTNTPGQIGTDLTWRQVSCGYQTTHAIKADGSLWGWGSNGFGQIGNGNRVNQSSPLRIGTANNWAMVASGELSTYAIKTDGTLWSWGSNNNGQLGIGNANDVYTPTQIGTATDWAVVSAGLKFGFAIKTDGSMWAWGQNNGQLGTGNTSSAILSPIRVGTANNWANVSCGLGHVAATTTNGTLFTCGGGSDGQLGFGNTSNTTSFAQVLSYNLPPKFIGVNVNKFDACFNGGFKSIANNMIVNDGNFGQNLTYSIQTNPIKGSLTFGSTVTPTIGGTIAAPTALNWQYKPNAGATGTDSFTIGVSDSFTTVYNKVIVTINTATSSNNNLTVCNSQMPYVWNGLTFNTAGTQTKTGLVNSKGCDSSATLILSVTTNVTPSVIISTTSSPICNGSNTTFNATPTNGGSAPTYQWKKNSSNVGTGSSITFSPGTLLTGDTISCVMAANNMCQTTPTVTSNKIRLTVLPSPSAFSITTSNLVGCTIGGSATIITNTWNTTWTSSNTSVATVTFPGGSGSNGTWANATGNGSTVLTATVTAANGCTRSQSVVYIVDAITPAVITGANTGCTGKTQQYTANIAGGVWASSNTAAAPISATGLLSCNAANSPIISYQLTNANNCSAITTKVIPISTSPAVPSINYAAGTNIPYLRSGANFCNNRNFTLVGVPTGGVWASTNAAVVTVTNAGIVNTVGTGTGSVTYTVTNAANCSSSSSIIGTVVACSPRGIQQLLGNSQWSLYPNPAKTFINLKVDNIIGAGSIVVTDLYGKQITQQALILGINTINVSKFAKGMYLVSVITEGGKDTRKIIVE